MSRIDRYMLSQLLLHFAFFALVLVAIFWINRAVQLFDRLIGDGQSARVFFEFTMLGLPKLITNVVPIAAFAGSVYVTHRMNNDSELTVMHATGSGPWRLVRPVFAYGLIVGLFMASLMHFAVPAAQKQLSKREIEISQNITSRLLSEGAFLSPAPSVTFYTQSIDDEGVLKNVFLSDRRRADRTTTYTAHEAYLVREDDEYTLIMVDGLAQQLDTETRRLSTTTFRDFSFNISALISSNSGPSSSVKTASTGTLLFDWPALSEATGFSQGSIAEEVHSRFAQPLFVVVAALVGFSTLLIGGYSRFGVWREVIIAFVLLLAIDGMRGGLIDAVLKDANLWAIMYIPSTLGAVLAISMLSYASKPAFIRRLTARKQAEPAS